MATATPYPRSRTRRAVLGAEIVQLERQLRARKESLGHVDATLRLLSPEIDIDAIPNKRTVKRIRLFRQGELGRLILGVLRDANCPVSTAQIVKAILAAGGHGQSAKSAVAPRVRGNLAYQERRGLVIKSGSRKAVCWSLQLRIVRIRKERHHLA